jgi:hypothetical protein
MSYGFATTSRRMPCNRENKQTLLIAVDKLTLRG